MKVYQSETEYDGGPCVAALGTFDGVHLGHRALIAAAVERGRALGVPALAYTFDKHPLSTLRPAAAPQPLLSPKQRRSVFAAMGLDALIERPFTPEFSRLSPEDFICLLARTIRPLACVAGYNYTFGRGGAGGVEALKALGAAHGFEAIIIPPVTLDGEPVSSTRIRNLLKAGDFALAARLMGENPAP